MTNGEVIMKIFPSAKVKHNVEPKVVTYTLDGYIGISVGEEWWKAPYTDTDRFEDTVCADTVEVLDEIIGLIDEGRCVVENEYDKGRNWGLYMATEIINEYKTKDTKHDDELISKLEILKSEIEWDYPLEYQVVLDEVIEKIKGEKDGKSITM